jgi:hypothetical protein
MRNSSSALLRHIVARCGDGPGGDGMNELANADWAVIGAYFALVYLVVFWHARTNRADATEFFLAGRNAGWFIAGSRAAGDFPAAQFELLAAFALLLLGWLFVPFYVRSGVFTMPEFLVRGPAYFSAPRYSPSGTGAPTGSSYNERLRPNRFLRHGIRAGRTGRAGTERSRPGFACPDWSVASGRPKGSGRGRTAGSTDEFLKFGVQLLRDADHDGRL